MSWIEGVRTRLAQTFRRGTAEDRIAEEIRFHIEMETEANLRAGLDPREARRRALLAFGGMEKHREGLRDGWRVPLVGGLGGEIALAFRGLRRSPGFSTVVVVTLALGVGATTAIYSLVDGVLLRQAPFAAVGELVVVWETDGRSGNTREPASLPDVIDFGTRSRTLAGIAGLVPMEVIQTKDEGDATRIPNMLVSDEFFSLVGIEPLLGRVFLPGEDEPGAEPVALISEAMWEVDHQRSRDVLGRSIVLGGRSHAIVGVVPDDADYGIVQILNGADYAPMTPDAFQGAEFDVWTPLPNDPELLPRSTHPVLTMGRLAPGMSLDAAQAELAAIAADLEATYPENLARGVSVQSLTDVVEGPVRQALLVLLSGVGVVLLIACANVASLLLARGTVRGREVAVRRALGAATPRLVRQFLAESMVLTGIAGVLGVGIGWLFLRAALVLAPGTISRVREVGLDARVLLAVVAIVAVIAFVFGLVPALQGRRIDIAAALTRGGARAATSGQPTTRARSLLVVAEVALAVVLLTSAGLLIRSFREVLQVDPGFRTAGVLKADLSLPPDRYPVNFDSWPNFEAAHRLNAAILDRVGALPGVEGVAVAGEHPLNRGFTNSFSIVGREAEAGTFPELSIRRVTPDYFGIFGTLLVEGRLFGSADDTFAPKVAILNAAAAERLFPGTDPIGQRIGFWGEERTIVGLIANEKFHGLTAEDPIAVYTPLAQTPSTNGVESVLVLVDGDPMAVAGSVRSVLREIDPAVAVSGVAPLSETLSRSLSERSFTTFLLGFFAAIALILAVIGVHSVLSHTMVQRTREMGIRMALGASRPRVMREVVVDSLGPVALGLVGGAIAALLAARLLAGLLYGVGPSDPLTVAATIFVILGASLAASFGPARRATGVAPSTALRAE